ncbi:MAG: hypothetical protein LW805_04605 [Oxalobacteraceae bacterium]|nr:hypothetical protein [Oxalobacteraceae bacterium]
MSTYPWCKTHTLDSGVTNGLVARVICLCAIPKNAVMKSEWRVQMYDSTVITMKISEGIV